MVRIPIATSIKNVDVYKRQGDTYVACNGASADDICTDCGREIPGIPEVSAL